MFRLIRKYSRLIPLLSFIINLLFSITSILVFLIAKAFDNKLLAKIELSQSLIYIGLAAVSYIISRFVNRREDN